MDPREVERMPAIWVNRALAAESAEAEAEAYQVARARSG